MPFKRTARKKVYRKKTGRKALPYKRVYKRAPSVPKGPKNPFPVVMRKQLTYSTALQITQAVAAVPQNYVFRANSVYDPDYTGTGTQPRYFDQLCGPDKSTALYQNYRVVSSRIRVDLWPTASSATDQNAVFSIIPLSAVGGTPSSLIEMMQRPFAKYARMTNLGSYKPYSCRSALRVAPFLGCKDIKDNENASALYNTDPNAVVYWCLSTCAVNPAGYSAISCVVTITYNVEFFGLNDVQDS